MQSTGQVGLSARVRRLLRTLERRPNIPTEAVEVSVVAAGCTPYAPGLDFHERYVGYVKQYYQDWFVWGLAHRDGSKIPNPARRRFHPDPSAWGR